MPTLLSRYSVLVTIIALFGQLCEHKILAKLLISVLAIHPVQKQKSLITREYEITFHSESVIDKTVNNHLITSMT